MNAESKWPRILGEAVLLIVLLVWTKVLFTSSLPGDPPWIFLDYANLIFHEAGHIIFLPFGQFLYVLGGSLGQLLVPAICLIAFIRQEDKGGTYFSLFWLGDSALNLSYYIGDARAQLLQLISGDGIHDWNWLLDDMHLLPQDTLIAGVVHTFGALAVLASLFLLGFHIYQALTRYAR